MTQPLPQMPLKKAQARALAAAARENGCIMEVEFGGMIWRAIPQEQEKKADDKASPFRL